MVIAGVKSLINIVEVMSDSVYGNSIRIRTTWRKPECALLISARHTRASQARPGIFSTKRLYIDSVPVSTPR